MYYTLCSDDRQKSRWKVKIYADDKPTFLKGAWLLKGSKKTINLE